MKDQATGDKDAPRAAKPLGKQKTIPRKVLSAARSAIVSISFSGDDVQATVSVSADESIYVITASGPDFTNEDMTRVSTNPDPVVPHQPFTAVYKFTTGGLQSGEEYSVSVTFQYGDGAADNAP